MDTQDAGISPVERYDYSKPFSLYLTEKQLERVMAFKLERGFISKVEAIRYLISLGLEQVERGGEIFKRIDDLDKGAMKAGWF